MSAVAWTQIQQALVTWVRGAIGLGQDSVLWAGQDAEEPAVPFATLQRWGPRTAGGADQALAAQIMEELVTVTAAAQQAYDVKVDDVSHVYGAGGSDTVQQIRDGLFTALALLEDIAAAAVGTAQIRLTGSEARPRFHTAVLPAGSIETTTETTAYLQHAAHQGQITVRLKVQTGSVRPAEHALALVGAAVANLQLPSVSKALRDAGCSFARRLNGPDDITAVVATKHRSAAVADLEFNVLSDLTEQARYVRKVEVTANVTEA